MIKNIPELITLREACQILNCHPNTLRLWDKKGILKAIHFGSRGDRRYHKNDLMKIARYDNLKQPLTSDNLSSYYPLLDHIHEPIIMTDNIFNIIYWNKGAEHLYGHTADEMLQQNLLKVLPLQSISNSDSLDWRNTLDKLGIWKGEVLHQHKNGSQLYIQTSISVIKDYLQQIIGSIIYNQNITRHISKEKSLQTTLKDLADIKYALDQSSIIAITDKNGVIEYVNNKFMEISKYTREELIGKTHRVINSKYHSKEFMKNLWTTITSGKVWHGVLRNRAKDGIYYWVDTTITPLLDENGKPKQYIAIRNDISQQKLLEQKKDEFINVVSHELKTPLTSAKAYAQLLMQKYRKSKETQLLRYLSRMNEQMNKLAILVSQLLETTRIQAGRLILNYSIFDLHQLTQEIIDDIEDTMSVTIKFISCQTAIVKADKERLAQVTANLLNNALKFSPKKKKIIVRLQKKGHYYLLSVQDFGIGIPDKEKAKIFQRFYQITDQKLQPSPSLGLGLYICKEIILQHDGKIWVDSVVNQGSIFKFTIPINISL